MDPGRLTVISSEWAGDEIQVGDGLVCEIRAAKIKAKFWRVRMRSGETKERMNPKSDLAQKIIVRGLLGPP